MNRTLLIASLLAVAAASAGCTDVSRAQFSAYSTPHRITMYSATGQVIKVWETDGKVANASGSDGYEFKDKATGKLIMVSGSVIIETL